MSQDECAELAEEAAGAKAELADALENLDLLNTEKLSLAEQVCGPCMLSMSRS